MRKFIFIAGWKRTNSVPSDARQFVMVVKGSQDSGSAAFQLLRELLNLIKFKQFQILPSHYLNGQLILRCTAEVGTYYADFTEAPLETTRKEPIPERGEKILFTQVLVTTTCRMTSFIMHKFTDANCLALFA